MGGGIQCRTEAGESLVVNVEGDEESSSDRIDRCMTRSEDGLLD